jgi:hypothetical protein
LARAQSNLNVAGEPLLPQQLGTICWAITRLPRCVAGDSLLAVMVRHVPGLVADLSPTEIANTCWAYGQVGTRCAVPCCVALQEKFVGLLPETAGRCAVQRFAALRRVCAVL